MNTENQIDPNVPAPGETESSELKDTVGWDHQRRPQSWRWLFGQSHLGCLRILQNFNRGPWPLVFHPLKRGVATVTFVTILIFVFVQF